MRLHSSRLFTLILLLVAMLAPLALAQDDATETPAEDVVVISFGDQTMSLAEFDERFLLTARNIAAQQGMELTDDMFDQLISLRPTYLDQLATELVLLTEADARGLTFSDEEVDTQLQTIIDGFESREEYEQLLDEAGFTNEDQLRRLIRENETIRLIVTDIEANLEISEEDVQAYYDANEANFQQPEQACTRHILLETEEDANDVISELDGGADFAALAEERSTGPSGPRGGDLGCLTPGQTVPAFNDAAFSAEIDEVVGPVETQFGFHVILVYERSDATVAPLEQVEENIRQQLRGEVLDEAIQSLRDDAGVEIFAESLGELTLPESEVMEDMGEGEMEDTDGESDMEDSEDSEGSMDESTDMSEEGAAEEDSMTDDTMESSDEGMEDTTEESDSTDEDSDTEGESEDGDTEGESDSP
ncbi:MAG: peptidyl-prolyl cis-trans isomerase [Deinococcota bacterium]